MTEPIRTRWGKAVDFAEVAEALDVSTTQIMATFAPQGRIEASESLGVLYTPNPDPESTVIHAVTLTRDADGIPVAGPSVEVPGMWERIQADIDRKLGR